MCLLLRWKPLEKKNGIKSSGRPVIVVTGNFIFCCCRVVALLLVTQFRWNYRADGSDLLVRPEQHPHLSSPPGGTCGLLQQSHVTHQPANGRRPNIVIQLMSLR